MSITTQRLKVFLYFCAILMIISGIAAAADRNVIIGFKNTVGANEENIVHGHGGVAKKNFHLIPAIAASIDESKIDELKKDPNVAYVEDDKIYNATDEYTSSWGVQHIGSEIVHDQGITGAGVKVAVLDTGIDYNHIDLKDNYKGGYNSIYSGNPDPMDDSGPSPFVPSHGTHVAGIIGAEKNGIGVVGVAPNVSLYAVKVLNGGGGGSESSIISGLQWSVDNNMNIVSMSFGNSVYSQALQDAVDKVYNSGILLVASAGNTGGFILYPAAYDSVIAVSATDASDQYASFSSNGPKIELAAPGVGIYSTIVGGGYDYRDGTSSAAPHVTGVAALIYSTNFGDVNGDGVKNNIDVRLILQNTAKDLGIPGRDILYGYGLVDAQNAVNSQVLQLKRTTGQDSTNGQTGPEIKDSTTGPEIKDSRNISLEQGNYSIKIKNINLTKVDMKVYENGIIRKDLSQMFLFNKSNDIEFSLDVEDTFNIIFIPYGRKESLGYVITTVIQ